MTSTDSAVSLLVENATKGDLFAICKFVIPHTLEQAAKAVMDVIDVAEFQNLEDDDWSSPEPNSLRSTRMLFSRVSIPIAIT